MVASAVGDNSKSIRSPSSLDDNERNEIRQSIVELVDSFQRVDSEREIQKDILKQIEEKYEVPKTMLRKLAVTYHKGDFVSQVETAKIFQNFYNIVLRESSTNDDDEDDGDND